MRSAETVAEGATTVYFWVKSRRTMSPAPFCISMYPEKLKSPVRVHVNSYSPPGELTLRPPTYIDGRMVVSTAAMMMWALNLPPCTMVLEFGITNALSSFTRMSFTSMFDTRVCSTTPSA